MNSSVTFQRLTKYGEFIKGAPFNVHVLFFQNTCQPIV